MRQIKRIIRRDRVRSLPGLISKKCSQPSNRRLNEETKRLSIELIGEHYRDFGPTLASEKLAERHGIHLCVEGARQVMMEAGYWQPRKGAKVCVGWIRRLRSAVKQTTRGTSRRSITLGEICPSASPPPRGVTASHNRSDAGKRGYFYL